MNSELLKKSIADALQDLIQDPPGEDPVLQCLRDRVHVNAEAMVKCAALPSVIEFGIDSESFTRIETKLQESIYNYNACVQAYKKGKETS